MKTSVILGLIIALLIGGIGGYFFSKTERYQAMMGWRSDTPRQADMPMEEIDHGMHGMPSTITEREFIEGMIPHHEEAVATAKEVLARGGTTPEMKTLVEDIITAQEKEIADMKRWYKDWYGEDYSAKDYTPMMRDLSSLSGKELDIAFLEDMIMHHMGALMMAQHVAPSIEHDELQTLAENIAETQSAEIISMRMLLRQLK